MKKPQYIVGIDLGTTHTVVSYAKLQKDIKSIVPTLFEIEQLVGKGVVAKRPMLPSFRYHPAEGEIEAHDCVLPWEPSELPGEIDEVIIGELARDMGRKTDGRLVVSAKSWLSHSAVDRAGPILPWAAPEEVDKVSPVLASASYLSYLKDAWNYENPSAPLDQQEVVITIPASFDEAARTLTVEAAAMAGLSDVLLIEEPQAVCYDWYLRHRDTAQATLENSHLLLVCDVGGGTTDFSLIKVSIVNDALALERVGVGDHLMLGGDNIDLALAHQTESVLMKEKQSEESKQSAVAGKKKLSLSALSQLIQQARTAKESLLSANAPAAAGITVLGSGAKLIGGSRTVSVEKSAVQALTLDGFFPLVQSDDLPRKRQSAVVEIGLPYASEPAVTKHIAEFLQGHQTVCREAFGTEREGFIAPDAVLFNGGIFNSPVVEAQVLQQLNQWHGSSVLKLENGHPDLAVAYGAVAYGLARRGAQLKISGGAARSYFLVVEAAGNEQRGVCLLTRGTAEDTELALTERNFALRVGEPVQFHLAATADDARFELGEIIALEAEKFRRLPPLISTLPKESSEKEVEVGLVCKLTEIGTIELDCVSRKNAAMRWHVEFEIRKLLKQQRAEGGLQFINPEDLPKKFERAIEEYQRYFGGSNKKIDRGEVKKLRPNLEKLLGRRDQWETPILRALFNQSLMGMKHRRRSQAHERVWFNLAGYCLRPGFGYPGDEYRMRKVWSLYKKGLQFSGENQSWSEWWTLWRRVSGGLNEAQQQRIYSDIQAYLDPEALTSRKLQSELKTRSYEDIVRLAGSLEHLGLKSKIELGDWFCQRLNKPSETETSWWALGRVGARVPFHGSADNVVPNSKVYEWIDFTFSQDWRKNTNAAFCAVMLSRMSGDPVRDIDPRFREKVLERLQAAKVPKPWLMLVESNVELEFSELKRVFGEALPVGIKLLD